jgi:DNA-binding response OmpR family regulator
MSSAKILVVDDEVSILRAYCADLETPGYGVTTTRDGKEAIRQSGDINPQLVLLYRALSS